MEQLIIHGEIIQYLHLFRLKKGADIESVNKKLTDIVVENNPQTTTKFSLFPLLDIHLHGQFGFKETRGPVIVVTIFTLIAIFILLIACINFINLSTAKATGRGKEIGIKKVAGADRMSMIIQFMLESLLLVAVAMILALILVGLSLGIFNNISGKNFRLEDLIQFKFIMNLILVGIVAGIVSGIYPALYLSSFKPVSCTERRIRYRKRQWQAKTDIGSNSVHTFNTYSSIGNFHVSAAEISSE